MDFKKIKLNPKQSLLLHSDNPATEILYGGAAGGGKSFALRIASIYYSFEIPGLQTWLLRRKSDDLRANHLEGSTGYLALLAPYINDGTCRINHTNATIIFNNGSVIHLEHCQHEKDRLNFQGFEIHLLLIDELTHFSESIYTYIRSRCRLGSFKVPEKYQHQFPRIIAGSNPGGVGHNFVKSTFIDIQPPFEVNARPKEDGGMKRQFIPATLEDNPYIESDYEDKLYGLGDKSLVDAMRFGKWDIISGGAIDDVWNRDVDVIKPFHIPKNWYVDRGFDWGSSKPYACLWFAESNGEDFVDDYGNFRSYPAGTVFIINELYGIKNNKPNAGTMETAAEVAKKIKAVETENSILQHLLVRPGPADSAIFGNNTGYDQSLYSMFYREAVEFTSAFKGPGSRVAGLEEIRTRLLNNKNFENKGLYIFNNCVNTIRTLPTLPRSESNYDDVDSNAEDHCYDVIRYKLLNRHKIASTTFDRFAISKSLDYKYN